VRPRLRRRRPASVLRPRGRSPASARMHARVHADTLYRRVGGRGSERESEREGEGEGVKLFSL
jgi:hypothetical protein